MKRFLALFALIALVPACATAVEESLGEPASSDASSSPPIVTPDAGSGSDVATSAETLPEDDAGAPPVFDVGTGETAGGGTGFTSARDMFDHVNATRTAYAKHIPYDGEPFAGTNASSMTWSLTLAWDDVLAKEAQKEADAIAAGATPKGNAYAYQPPNPGEGLWVSGLDSARYMVSAMSNVATKGKEPTGFTSGDPGKWHLTHNGMYRLAVAYQTGSKTFNHKTKLGVGMAAGAPGIVWWVLVFGE